MSLFTFVFICYFPLDDLSSRVRQTGKDEYDTSLEEEKKHSAVTGSVFQGLRADLEGWVEFSCQP